MDTKKRRLMKRKRALKRELLRIKRGLIALGAKKIILFGSLASGRVRRTTDIDLLVVKDSDARFSDRLKEVYDKIAPRMASDILIYTQDEFNKLSKTSIFVRRAIKEGKVLYGA